MREEGDLPESDPALFQQVQQREAEIVFENPEEVRTPNFTIKFHKKTLPKDCCGYTVFVKQPDVSNKVSPNEARPFGSKPQFVQPKRVSIFDL